MLTTTALAALIDLNGPQRNLHWGRFVMSLANLTVIVAMLAVFALAVLLPYRRVAAGEPAAIRRQTGSWAYALGMLSLGALLIVIASGGLIALAGPAWWHHSRAGRFINSVHLWSTELFFLFMVVHLWAKFFAAAWRGRRELVWITGGVTFLVSIPSAFTGYLSQQNFDAQWIALEAKDGLNAGGIGAFFNPLDVGQMLLWHVLLLPLGLGLLIWIHLRLVRRCGFVPPFPEKQ